MSIQSIKNIQVPKAFDLTHNSNRSVLLSQEKKNVWDILLYFGLFNGEIYWTPTVNDKLKWIEMKASASKLGLNLLSHDILSH